MFTEQTFDNAHPNHNQVDHHCSASASLVNGYSGKWTTAPRILWQVKIMMVMVKVMMTMVKVMMRMMMILRLMMMMMTKWVKVVVIPIQFLGRAEP